MQLVRLWRLRALMYSQPGYEEDLATLRNRDRSGDVPLDDLIAGLTNR